MRLTPFGSWRPTASLAPFAMWRYGYDNVGIPLKRCPTISFELPREEHDPDFFEKCVPINRCFDFRKFGWVAVVAATEQERDQSPLGSFYIYDGLHKTLVLAKRLLAGETTYQPIEALYLIPRA